MADDVANEDEVDIKAEISSELAESQEPANEPAEEPAGETPAEPTGEQPTGEEAAAESAAEPSGEQPAEPAEPADPYADIDANEFFRRYGVQKGYDFQAAGYQDFDDFLAKHMQLEQAIPYYQDVDERYRRLAPYAEDIERLRRGEYQQQPQESQEPEPQGFQVPKMPDEEKFFEFYEKKAFIDPHGREVERWVPRPECPASYRAEVEAWDNYEKTHRKRWRTEPHKYIEDMGFARMDAVQELVREEFNRERERQENWAAVNDIVANLPEEYVLPNGNLSPRGVTYQNFVTQFDNYYQQQYGIRPDPNFINHQARNAEFFAYHQGLQQQGHQETPAQPEAQAPPAQPAAQPASRKPSPASGRAPNRRAAAENPEFVPDENTRLSDLLVAEGTDKDLARIVGG